MVNHSRVSGSRSPPAQRSIAFVGVSLFVATVSPVAARAETRLRPTALAAEVALPRAPAATLHLEPVIPPPPDMKVEVPGWAAAITRQPVHLTLDDQTFDASTGGLRRYLDTIRSTKPELFSALTPDVKRMEQRETEAAIFMGAGVGAAVISAILGIVLQRDCTAPSLTDPDFGAKAQAWGDCNGSNMSTAFGFGALASVSLTVGLAGMGALTPSRWDVLRVVNKQNRLSDQPLRFELGYGPSTRQAPDGPARGMY